MSTIWDHFTFYPFQTGNGHIKLFAKLTRGVLPALFLYLLGLSGAGFGNAKPNAMGLAGAAIAMASNSTLRSQQPFSFKAAIDHLEDDIMQLKQEVANARKEVRQLKGEQDTVEDVAKS